MEEIAPKTFPNLIEKYIHAMNRFYPSTIQLVILSYLAAQADPIPQSYVLQKLQRIYPKHSEKMLFNELGQLGLKKIIQFDSEQRYWFDVKYINDELEAVFRSLETELINANLEENYITQFALIKQKVLSLQDNILQILPSFHQTRNKDLKKFFRNIIRKYGLDPLFIAFEQHSSGTPINFEILIENLTRDFTQNPVTNPPTIAAPLGRNIYNAHRKVKQYNETAKGTRLFFYSEKKPDTTNSEDTPAAYKESIVFGVPRIGERVPKLPRVKSKKKKEQDSDHLHTYENPLELIDASKNVAENQPNSQIVPQIRSISPLSIPSEVKRRGRPPKNPDILSQEEHLPRPRGRPPKPKDIEASLNDQGLPRPRGRPPKPKDFPDTIIGPISPKPRGRPPKHRDNLIPSDNVE